MKKTEQLDGPGRNSRLDHITCDVLSNRTTQAADRSASRFRLAV